MKTALDIYREIMDLDFADYDESMLDDLIFIDSLIAKYGIFQAEYIATRYFD